MGSTINDAFDFFSTIERDMRTVAEEKGLQFEMILGTIQNSLAIDPDPLRQAIIHLIENAIEFTDWGKIELRIRQQDGTLIIEIEDTGHGLSGDHPEDVFDAPGLAKTMQDIKLLNGTITPHTKINVGTQFTIGIPLEN